MVVVAIVVSLVATVASVVAVAVLVVVVVVAATSVAIVVAQVVTIVGAGHRSVDVLVVVDRHVSVLSLSTCRLFLKLRPRDLGLELFRSFALWLCSGI